MDSAASVQVYRPTIERIDASTQPDSLAVILRTCGIELKTVDALR
ncbi:MAG: hypothetical protein ABSE55_03380 [Terracidiphilus sp.]|jgi:hypothetical protein